MRTISILGLCVASLGAGFFVPRLAAQTPPARVVTVKFNQGKVTVVAAGVTVREVMAEWGRQCSCVVQGADRLPGGTLMPMEFDDVPESVVLESLLRNAGGYMLGPRLATNPAGERASMYGSIAVFPVSRGTAPAYQPSSSAVAAPLVSGGTPDDEIPPAMPFGGAQVPAQTPAGRGPAVPIVPAGPTTTTPPAGGRSGGRGLS